MAGDFGVGEEVLELFGAGHAEGGEAVAGLATSNGEGARELVHVEEGGVRVGVGYGWDGFFDDCGNFPAGD